MLVFRQARVLEGYTGNVRSVAVSLEKGILVSASDDFTIRVWSLEVVLPVKPSSDDNTWCLEVTIETSQ